MQNLGDRLDQEGLGQPGDTGEQTVPAGKERDQDLIDDFILPDDDLAELVKNPLAPFLNFRCKTTHAVPRLSHPAAPSRT